jgi:serine phosphatase RsbU (regulator of sigma subunit)
MGTLTARRAVGDLVEWAVRAVPLAGETESGDAYLVAETDTGAMVAVVDALGHGPEAAAAARAAIACLEASASHPLQELVRRCDTRLRGTRGAALAAAAIARDGSTTWIGVGNVEAVLMRASGRGEQVRQYLVQRPGVVGWKLPALRPASISLSPGDVLVLASDGIRSGFAERLPTGGEPARIAALIETEHARTTDDALVLVVRYRGAGG